MAKSVYGILPAFLALIACLAISACGSQSDATATPANGTASTTTPQTTQPTQATSSSQLTPTELKYLLVGKYANDNNLLYCDPDSFPVNVAPEEVQKRAEAKVSEMQSTIEEYDGILEHNNLKDSSGLDREETLLVYSEHKKLNAIKLEPAGDNSYNFTIQVGKLPDRTEGEGSRISGTIDESGAITDEARQDVMVECPICLAGDTLIGTPNGPVRVKDLRQGMTVWTLDSSGLRHAVTISKTAKRAVASPHEMVRIILKDGRELLASPRHPTKDGQSMGSLSPGDSLDNSQVVKIEYVTSNEDATYDILPSGETGFYWANGILVASTLRDD